MCGHPNHDYDMIQFNASHKPWRLCDSITDEEIHQLLMEWFSPTSLFLHLSLESDILQSTDSWTREKVQKGLLFANQIFFLLSSCSLLLVSIVWRVTHRCNYYLSIRVVIQPSLSVVAATNDWFGVDLLSLNMYGVVPFMSQSDTELMWTRGGRCTFDSQ